MEAKLKTMKNRKKTLMFNIKKYRQHKIGI